jgi:hypothetical protein
MSKTLQKEKEPPAHGDINRSEVARRAYELWEADGRPSGRDMDYWLQAEAGLAGGKSNRASGRVEVAGTKSRV